MDPVIDRVTRLHELLSKITSIQHVEFYMRYIGQAQNIFEEKSMSSWLDAVEKTKQILQGLHSNFLEEGDLCVNATLKEELTERLLNLQPINGNYKAEDTFLKETDADINEVLASVKEDVKKGNRVSFKLLQQLEEKLEHFIENKEMNENENVDSVVEDLQRRSGSLRELVLDMFDQLDVMYQASIQLNDEVMSEEVAKVVDKGLQLLNEFGIEELKVEGQLIDGKTMVSLGNVSREQYAPHLDKYQVYSVHRRGFQDKETKELIRKATVITVD